MVAGSSSGDAIKQTFRSTGLHLQTFVRCEWFKCADVEHGKGRTGELSHTISGWKPGAACHACCQSILAREISSATSSGIGTWQFTERAINTMNAAMRGSTSD